MDVPTRVAAAFSNVAIFLAPLAMFCVSVLALHKPEVIAVLLLQTAAGWFEVLGLLATALSPVICALLIFGRINRFWLRYPIIVGITGFLTVFYAVSIGLLAYRLQAGVAFDPAIFRYHFADGLRTLYVLSAHDPWIVAVFVGLIGSHFFGLLRARSAEPAREPHDGAHRAMGPVGYNISLPICLSLTVATQWHFESGFMNLLLESRQESSAAKLLYLNYFNDSVGRSQMAPKSIVNGGSQANLFIVQLESVNAALVGPRVTPRLVEFAKEHGVFFPRMQAPSVFTVLSMETILCSTLPTLEQNLAAMETLHGRLHCLPRIFKEMGYKTIYFQAYPDLRFNNMGAFFRAIGFDETHAEDIMKPGDQKLRWGYAENVFYRRVFEYLEPLRGEKLFVYIVAGSANHYPFDNEEIGRMFPDLRRRAPYSTPGTLKERMANTMFVQDHFYGEMYQHLYLPRFAETSHMFVFGDHSWPIEIHHGNFNNLKGAFQENFLTAMAFKPRTMASQAILRERAWVVQSLHSYLDLPATILDIYGLKSEHAYGRSFAHELWMGQSKRHEPSRCIVSVQPFSGGGIVIIRFPMKFFFDLKNQKMLVYNLEADPNELNPVQIREIDKNGLVELQNCLTELSAVTGSAVRLDQFQLTNQSRP